MADPFIAEIVMFGGNFAPRSWANCDGQLLPISQNSAMFSILGTMYGGDGRTTFALPDCRGRRAVHPGNGPGLSSYSQGPGGGNENVTLTVNNMPSHSHGVSAVKNAGNSFNPSGAFPATDSGLTDRTFSTESASATMNSGMVQNAGGGQQFSIIEPWVGVRFIIATQGIFPSRN